MDRQAGHLANVLLGNNVNDAVIEMTMTGVTLEFNCQTLICISGADMSPKLNDIPVSNHKVIKVRSKDVLTFGKLKNGFRTYLAVLEGFKTQQYMKSRSMYKGITLSSQLKKGDHLKIVEFDGLASDKNAVLKVNTNYIINQDIEVFKGPEFDLLSAKQQSKLVNENFTISNTNNRMAYQLKESFENNLDAIITSPVLPGTVQLTPSGKLIILMRDCQTTGGYPRVLQLKNVAIDALSQKFTGNNIAFKIII
jgi:biotin-dependent carboxylase-like uncharacterized protein